MCHWALHFNIITKALIFLPSSEKTVSNVWPKKTRGGSSFSFTGKMSRKWVISLLQNGCSLQLQRATHQRLKIKAGRFTTDQGPRWSMIAHTLNIFLILATVINFSVDEVCFGLCRTLLSFPILLFAVLGLALSHAFRGSPGQGAKQLTNCQLKMEEIREQFQNRK